MIALNPFPKADFLGNRPFPRSCLDNTNPGASWQKTLSFLNPCVLRGAAPRLRFLQRLRQGSRSVLGTLSAALSERFRNAFGSNSERPRQRPRSALSNALGSLSATPLRSALGSGCGTLAEAARSALGSALGAPSERSRLRSRSAFGTHSDQTRNALGSALGTAAPSLSRTRSEAVSKQSWRLPGFLVPSILSAFFFLIFIC